MLFNYQADCVLLGEKKIDNLIYLFIVTNRKFCQNRQLASAQDFHHTQVRRNQAHSISQLHAAIVFLQTRTVFWHIILSIREKPLQFRLLELAEQRSFPSGKANYISILLNKPRMTKERLICLWLALSVQGSIVHSFIHLFICYLTPPKRWLWVSTYIWSVSQINCELPNRSKHLQFNWYRYGTLHTVANISW